MKRGPSLTGNETRLAVSRLQACGEEVLLLIIGGISLNRSQGYIVAATVGFSCILVFSTTLKETGMSSFEQLFLRLGFAFVILLGVMVSRGRLVLTNKKDLQFFSAFGCTYALFARCGLSAIAFGTPVPYLGGVGLYSAHVHSGDFASYSERADDLY